MRSSCIFAAIVLAAAGGDAHADPCEAQLPRLGQAFAGLVRYVGDGDSLCVGPSSDPKEWIEVRLGDFYAPELREPGGEAAKHALQSVALNRQINCVAGKRSYDRVIAVCRLGGAPIGDILRARGAREGGRGSQ